MADLETLIIDYVMYEYRLFSCTAWVLHVPVSGNQKYIVFIALHTVAAPAVRAAVKT